MRKLLIVGITALFTATAFAAEVGGVKLADKVAVGGQELVLNGAGIRSRAIFKVYVGSLGDNPDITDFYGYFDLKFVIGQGDGLTSRPGASGAAFDSSFRSDHDLRTFGSRLSPLVARREVSGPVRRRAARRRASPSRCSRSARTRPRGPRPTLRDRSPA